MVRRGRVMLSGLMYTLYENVGCKYDIWIVSVFLTTLLVTMPSERVEPRSSRL
jgi:hypothetical protein